MTRLSDAERAVVEHASTIARELCDELRPELLARTGTIGSDMKVDGTPVTDADLWVNERIVAVVEERFPEHVVLSEELGTHYAGAEWTWIVDPIDGTSNFTAGVPYWCVSIALAHEGSPVYGLVDSPPLGVRFEAVLGEGATRNGEPVSVRPPVDFDDAGNRHVPLLLTTVSARRARRRIRLKPRVMGSAALDLCLFAAGTAAAAISLEPKVWDHAAGSLIVTEAGGSYVTLSGEPLLPLRPDTEYAGRSAASAAGPDEDYLEALVARLTLREAGLARH